MATYREIGGDREYPKPKDYDPGEVMVEGIYRRETHGKFGPQYEFENTEGEVVVLGSWGQLKYKMAFITVNDHVKVIYEGVEKMPSGQWQGAKVHQFTVLVMDEDEPEDLTGGDKEFGDL